MQSVRAELADPRSGRNRWLGIELRHFTALAAIASERSFRGAADRLGYVQSAISRQIAFLEELTGTRLVDRRQGPRHVKLTEAGERLLRHAEQILMTIEAAKADLDLLEPRRSDKVRLGIFPGIPMRILPRALLLSSRRDPDVKISLTEQMTDEPLFELVSRGAVDLAFAHLPASEGPFDCVELARVPWVLLVPAGTQLSRTRPPTPAELVGVPLIVTKSPRTQRAVETRLREELGAPRILFRSDLAHTAQTLVAAGVGVALVPRLAIDERDPRTAIVDVGGLLPPLSFGLVWHRDRKLGGAADELRDVIRQVCARVDRGQPSVAPAPVPLAAASGAGL